MPIVDSHAHIGDFPGFISGGNRSADMLIKEWDATGIDCGMISVLDRRDVPAANDRTRMACARHPDRIYGYIYLYPPDIDGSLRELDRCASLDCFRGVKLHPMNDAYYPFSEDWYPVYARIEALELPILWHSGTTPYSHPLQIASVAAKFGSTHILGHFGIAELSWECAPAAELASNIVVDTSINPVISLLNDFVDKFGPDRVLWGSDYPWYHVEYEYMKVQFLGQSDADRAKIAGENAVQLFRL